MTLMGKLHYGNDERCMRRFVNMAQVQYVMAQVSIIQCTEST